MKKSPRRPRATDTQVTYRPSLWIRVKNALSGQGVSRKNRRKRSKAMTSVWQRVRTAANSSGRGVGAGILGLAPHMGIVIIGLAIPVVVALGYRYLTNTPSLSIREVQVEGNQRVTPPEILEAAGVAHGPNLLALDLDDVETGLIAHPWVRTAKAERALPDRLHIKLSERTPALLLSLPSSGCCCFCLVVAVSLSYPYQDTGGSPSTFGSIRIAHRVPSIRLRDDICHS